MESLTDNNCGKIHLGKSFKTKKLYISLIIIWFWKSFSLISICNLLRCKNRSVNCSYLIKKSMQRDHPKYLQHRVFYCCLKSNKKSSTEEITIFPWGTKQPLYYNSFCKWKFTGQIVVLDTRDSPCLGTTYYQNLFQSGRNQIKLFGTIWIRF